MKQNKMNNINIAALLKNYPKGTKLYSPMCGECELEEIWNNGKDTYINVRYGITENNKGSCYRFNADGTFTKYGECLLFPSKEMHCWNYFNVKYVRGVIGKGKEIKALLENNGGIDNDEYYYEDEECIYFIDNIDKSIEAIRNSTNNELSEYIISTGTELKLEEEKIKFKAGDIICYDGICYYVEPCAIQPTHNILYTHGLEKFLAPTASLPYEQGHFATSEEITKWNEETLHPNNLHYSQSKRNIIDWFNAFDKVIIRSDSNDDWHIDFFDEYDANDDECPYHGLITIGYKCLLYNNKTKHLIGTTNEYIDDEKSNY